MLASWHRLIVENLMGQGYMDDAFAYIEQALDTLRQNPVRVDCLRAPLFEQAS